MGGKGARPTRQDPPPHRTAPGRGAHRGGDGVAAEWRREASSGSTVPRPSASRSGLGATREATGPKIRGRGAGKT
eukprot:2542166-Prorocentrum_lima.AAC.1